MTIIAPWLSVRDASAAVDFYTRAFAAVTAELSQFDGVVQVAQLLIGGAPFWVQQDDDLPASADLSPTVRMIVTADDPGASFAAAVAAGATRVAAVHEEHGWRTGRVADPFGHQWEFARRTH